HWSCGATFAKEGALPALCIRALGRAHRFACRLGCFAMLFDARVVLAAASLRSFFQFDEARVLGATRLGLLIRLPLQLLASCSLGRHLRRAPRRPRVFALVGFAFVVVHDPDCVYSTSQSEHAQPDSRRLAPACAEPREPPAPRVLTASGVVLS